MQIGLEACASQCNEAKWNANATRTNPATQADAPPPRPFAVRDPAVGTGPFSMATPEFTARTLRRLLASGVNVRAERLLAKMPPADVAPLLTDLTNDETRTVIELLFRQRRAALVLRELPLEMLPQVFEAVTDQRLADVLARLEIDDLIELIECVPEERREEVSRACPHTAATS